MEKWIRRKGETGDSFSGSDLWLAPLLLVCSATD